MIPREPPPPGPGAKAERLLFEALDRALSEEFFVYCRLPYICVEGAREGEADFVVLHRQLGLVVIECKGSGVRRTGTGQWVRLGAGGGETPLGESPFLQAQRHAKELRRELERRMAHALPGVGELPFVTGHAVAFPMALLDRCAGELPLEAPREILLDAADLDAAGERVQGIFDFWRQARRRRVTPLRKPDFKGFRKRVLHPALSVVECLGAGLRADGRSLLQLSEEQVRAVEGWLDNPRLRILGGAGTGKTVIALEAARRLADEGRSVLLVCFNRHLGEHLAATVGSWQLDGGKVHATTFHRLCARASWQQLDEGLRVPQDKEAAVAYWRDDAPLVLVEALEAGSLDRYDAVVVDEGQDFAPAWWDVLEMLVADGAEGRLAAFYDPSQEVFGRGCSVPESWPVIRLHRNFRNTRAIGEVVARLGGVEMRSHSRCPEGVLPETRPLESPSKMRRRLDELVRRLVTKERLLPDQIAVLTPHTKKSSSLAEVGELGGFPLSENPGDRAGAVLHTTITAFKGLESDVVILSDVDTRDPRADRNARYVAASRARHLLYVFSRGDWMG